MSSFSQSRCFVVSWLRQKIYSLLNCSASKFFFLKLLLILASHLCTFFSRHKWDLVGIVFMRKKIIVFLKIPKIENCFDRFRKQFIIFFSSFLELFEGQSEMWNFYFEFWRKLNIFIIFDICFIIGRLSWDQRK